MSQPSAGQQKTIALPILIDNYAVAGQDEQGDCLF